ncbi:hypothetical protein J4429_06055 [Candidatus Pacearchaeota archaeon]|nr:hypothetical protein [Candidatus Pacearchaeota archaeon]
MTEENQIYTCLIRNNPEENFSFYTSNFNYPFSLIPVLRQRKDAERRFKNFLSLNQGLETLVVDLTPMIGQRLIHSDCVYFLEDDKLFKETEYVNGHVDELTKQYGEKFIAVHNGKVIDSDEDDFKLATRTEDLAREVGPILISKLRSID